MRDDFDDNQQPEGSNPQQEVDPDLRDSHQSEDDEMDAETQAAIAFWNTGKVVGSSNLTMSVPQQAVYFTASDKEVAA